MDNNKTRHVLSWTIILPGVIFVLLMAGDYNRHAQSWPPKTRTFTAKDTNLETQQQPNNTTAATNKKKIYAYARPDQTGRQFLLFIKLEAAAHAIGATVGGVCPHYDRFQADDRVESGKRHVQEAQALVQYLGLDSSFVYACPTEDDLQSGRALFMGPKKVEKASESFLAEEEDSDETQPTAEEWLASLSSRVSLPKSSSDDSRLRVAVHVRRGDVEPCMGRYLSNEFYEQVFDEYLPEFCGPNILENCKVTLYSQSQTHEPFTSFVEHGYDLDLDSPLQDVWKNMIQADVFVISESAFSFVPALLNPNVVIHTGKGLHFRRPANWKMIDPDIREKAEIGRVQLCLDLRDGSV